jgi:hypothetical protein
MAKQSSVVVSITPPNFKAISLRVVGSAPLLMHKFSEKMRKQIEEKQTKKDQTTKKREPKDYAAEFNAARYVSKAGWDGIPCAMFRGAMIAACRTITGLPMTKAKGAFTVKSHGFEVTDGTPLVKINGKAKHDTRPVRLESGVADMRNRPRYDDWSADLTIEYDADMMSATDIANLLARAGAQVGIAELRPQGANSFGGDCGTFTVETAKRGKKAA